MSEDKEKKPELEFEIVFDDINIGVEPYYFQMLKLLEMNKYKTEKVNEWFTATEMSSFWSDLARRKGEQETKAMQLMGTINGMVKDLFKILREARFIKERLSFYEDSRRGVGSADESLKDVWVSLVEEGSKNPGSVLGLATQVGFIALPDLFYTTRINLKKDVEIDKLEPGEYGECEDVDEVVEKLYGDNISEKLKMTLRRKLKQFVEWRKRTYRELFVRKKFTESTLKTLIQQIRLYTTWVRPYLRTIKKLQAPEQATNKPELVTAFETSALEIELKGVKEDNSFGDNVAVIKIKFEQITTPQQTYQKGPYDRGYTHKGKVKITMQSYLYTKEELNKEKEDESEELIEFLTKEVDQSIKTLGDDLKHLLNEEYDKLWEPKKNKEESQEKVEKKGLFTNLKKTVLDVFPFLEYISFTNNDLTSEFKNWWKNVNPEKKFKKEKELQAVKKVVSLAKGKDVTEEEPDLYKMYNLFKLWNGLLRVEL